MLEQSNLGCNVYSVCCAESSQGIAYSCFSATIPVASCGIDPIDSAVQDACNQLYLKIDVIANHYSGDRPGAERQAGNAQPG
jgi:hypothetical protein